MRALIQRVSRANVTVECETVAEIGEGLLVLICAIEGDGEDVVDRLAIKISKLRIFPDAGGKTNLSVQDVGGAALVVSQFTLAASWRKGNRPGFSRALEPGLGEALYDRFAAALAATGVPVAKGVFGAEMKVSLVNDGPFTIWMDSENPD